MAIAPDCLSGRVYPESRVRVPSALPDKKHRKVKKIYEGGSWHRPQLEKYDARARNLYKLLKEIGESYDTSTGE